MRTIYLIRHGEPDFPNGKRCCLGRLDLPLSEKGKSMASALRQVLIPLAGSHVISSPLKRCTETALQAGFGHFVIEEDFAEVDTGDWDGLEFSRIRVEWPKEYAARGVDEWNEPFPGGESLNDCYVRASKAMKKVLKQYPAGDLFIFAHRGAIQALYAFLTGKSREEVLKFIPDYCAPVALLMDENTVIAENILDPTAVSGQIPKEEKCFELLGAYKTPEKVIRHCMAVKEKALKLCKGLEKNNIHLNMEAVSAAALLHDIARAEKDHARRGAEYLFSKGFTLLAPIIGDHMELPEEEEQISEKSAVFMADKYIKETDNVSLKERYLSGREGEMLTYAEEKMKQAVRMEKQFERSLQDEI